MQNLHQGCGSFAEIVADMAGGQKWDQVPVCIAREGPFRLRFSHPFLPLHLEALGRCAGMLAR